VIKNIIYTTYMPFVAIALVIAAALGGGTAAAAQASLPGDALWGFKVHVNERLAGALTASDQAHADWDLNSIKARLSEAEKLSAKGALSANVQADIAANLKLHADNITNIVAKLQANNDAQTAANIAARYQAELAGAPAPMSVSVQPSLEAATSMLASVSASLYPLK
jgi:hypothetical protein